MPYITQGQKQRFTAFEHGLFLLPTKMTKGELNFCITRLIHEYVHHSNTGEVCYDAINDVMGALASAQAEFYRRVAGPYEDKKIAENGDVLL